MKLIKSYICLGRIKEKEERSKWFERSVVGPEVRERRAGEEQYPNHVQYYK